MAAKSRRFALSSPAATRPGQAIQIATPKRVVARKSRHLAACDRPKSLRANGKPKQA
jgi:hypothetical protein